MQSNKCGICADHAGYRMKEFVKELLFQRGVEVIDLGTHSPERVDYPDFAHALGSAIDTDTLSWGIAVCGSGNGITMALNKHAKVRAALAWTPQIATLARQHNDANVLSLPGRFISEEEARRIVEAFLESDFEGGRHSNRVAKIACVDCSC